MEEIAFEDATFDDSLPSNLPEVVFPAHIEFGTNIIGVLTGPEGFLANLVFDFDEVSCWVGFELEIELPGGEKVKIRVQFGVGNLKLRNSRLLAVTEENQSVELNEDRHAPLRQARADGTILFKLEVCHDETEPRAYGIHSEFCKIHPELSELSKFLLSQGRLTIWAEGNEVQTQHNDFVQLFQPQEANNPLRAWYPEKHRNKMTVQFNEQLEASERPTYSKPMPQRINFPSVEYFCTVVIYGELGEHEYQSKLHDDLRDAETAIRFMTVPGGGVNRFLITLEQSTRCKLTKGDHIIVELPRLQEGKVSKWHASIVDPLPEAPFGDATAVMNRKFDKEEMSFDDYPLPSNVITDPFNVTPDNLSLILLHAPSIKGYVEVQDSNLPFRRICRGTKILRLRLKKGDQYAQMMFQTLLLNDLLSLPETDLLGEVLEDLDENDLQSLRNWLMSLNLDAGQKTAFDSLMNPRGLINILLGPPGTGKTYLILCITAMFVRLGIPNHMAPKVVDELVYSEDTDEEELETTGFDDVEEGEEQSAKGEEPHKEKKPANKEVLSKGKGKERVDEEQSGRTRAKIIIVSPSNQNTDKIARKAVEFLKLKCPERHPVVLRVHQTSSELSAVYNYNTQRPPPANSRPPMHDDALIRQIEFENDLGMIKDEMLVAFLVLSKSKGADQRKYPGVDDERITDINHSLAVGILHIAGVDGYIVVWSLNTRETRLFCEFYRRYTRGARLSDSEMKQFKRLIRIMCILLLERADVLSTTTIGATEPLISRYFYPFLGFVDEASKFKDGEIMAFTGLFKCRWIMAGDQFQTRPLVQSAYEKHTPPSSDSPRDTNTWGRLLQRPTFMRFILGGMKQNMLDVNHRMMPHISAVISYAFYMNRLTNSDSVVRESQDPAGLAAKVRAFNIANFDKDTNFLIFNVKGSSEVTVGTSKYNPHHTAQAINLCRDLIRSGFSPQDICLECFYEAQENKYRACLFKMEEASKDWKDSEGNRINPKGLRLVKVDATQGAEFPIGICELPNTRKPGFLKHGSRICVAMSRFKYGAYVILNSDKLFKGQKQHLRPLRKVVDYAENKNVIKKIRDNPQSDLYADIVSREPEGATGSGDNAGGSGDKTGGSGAGWGDLPASSNVAGGSGDGWDLAGGSGDNWDLAGGSGDNWDLAGGSGDNWDLAGGSGDNAGGSGNGSEAQNSGAGSNTANDGVAVDQGAVNTNVTIDNTNIANVLASHRTWEANRPNAAN